MINKSHEKRLRRAAAHQGLRLTKSRDTYGLVDAGANTLVCGDHQTGCGLTLTDVDEELRHRATT